MAPIEISTFPDPGLYLLWPDGRRLDLTRARIEACTRAMLNDPTKIPPQVKAATDYQACDICPQRDTAEICHSIMTALPFMEDIDQYMSYDRVVAVYRETNSEVLQVTETSMQEALKFISILSLTHYCEVGRKYGPYFEGVNPLMPPPELAAAVYRNLFLVNNGDMDEVRRTLETMQTELLQTARCQIARLQLISRRDAFLNAFVATHTTTQLLFEQLQQHLARANPVTV